jgi:hypothetical protein
MIAPEYVTWMDGEHHMRHVTAAYRHALLADYGVRYHLHTFLETGTCEGDTLEALLPYFDALFSVEITEHYYRRAKARFAENPKVTVLHGDSGSPEFREILKSLPQPALIYLDAHSSGGMTCPGPSPLLEELRSILELKIKAMVIVDDMNAGGLDAATGLIASYSQWDQEWRDQILRVNLL